MSLYKPIQDGHNSSLLISVRTGKGDLKSDRTFTDVVETVNRKPRFNVGWQAVTYKRQRYQLFGGIRTGYFICLSNPLSRRERNKDI